MALRAAPGRSCWLARALAAPGATRILPPPLLLLPPAAASALPLAGLRPMRPAARFASTSGQGPEAEGPQRRVVVVRITSPFAWLRTRFYYLLIRLYFDQEFSIEEFTRGAKQAFSVVSKLLSQRKLDLLDELVSAEGTEVADASESSGGDTSGLCLVTGCQLGLPYYHPYLCSKNFGAVLVHPHWTILPPIFEQK